MKLIAKTQDYIGRKKGAGIFPDAFIEDIHISHDRFNKILIIDYGLVFTKESKQEIAMQGRLRFTNDTNVPSQVRNGNEIVTVHHFLEQNQSVPLNDVIDWGFPSYDVALLFFENGSPSSPELTIKDWVGKEFAKAWILNNLIIDDAKVGDSFDWEIA